MAKEHTMAAVRMRAGHALRQNISDSRQGAINLLEPRPWLRGLGVSIALAARPSGACLAGRRRRESAAELVQQRLRGRCVQLGRGDAHQLRRQFTRCRKRMRIYGVKVS